MQKNFSLTVLLSSHMRICGGDTKTYRGGRGTQGKFGERDTQPLTNEEMLHGLSERRRGTPGPPRRWHAGQPGTRLQASEPPILDAFQRRKTLPLIPRAVPAQKAPDSWPSQPQLLLAQRGQLTPRTAGGWAAPVRADTLPNTCRGHRHRPARGSHQHTLSAARRTRGLGFWPPGL